MEKTIDGPLVKFGTHFLDLSFSYSKDYEVGWVGHPVYDLFIQEWVIYYGGPSRYVRKKKRKTKRRENGNICCLA